ncbi:alpha/beta hydrolase domain-containing protein [Paraburkholderia rhizosphaerae]|uniref:Alpha/beta hydrolase domain-containing protein n=1 Tax=Paraburkholderia rhizosphaerae TaxID=480658 RepID=A0A4R8LND0_9BURK|nr:alpha/beta hydrolase domain-containing protein [Paraburkholderia rhizosphaerae]TDY45150.1 hypothetical protein BX592_115117 [Paraburkholderia rhizosphaerae]
MVDYSMDFYILRPVDLSKGNHKVFYEIENRGSKQFGAVDESSGGNNPTTAADAGDAFLMNQGYTLVWSGWDPGGRAHRPFAPMAAARTSIGDPRPSLTERYGTHAGYVAAVTAAAQALEAQRMLLPADVQTYITNAQAPVTVINNPVYGSYAF